MHFATGPRIFAKVAAVIYLLEISNLEGGPADEDRFARIESASPIPIPSVGDNVLLQTSGVLRVERRLFGFYPATEQSEATSHVQLFCRVEI
ncbi:MAG: hypothetical protein RIC55_27830 [Pirellulaceae bacterium]